MRRLPVSLEASTNAPLSVLNWLIPRFVGLAILIFAIQYVFR